MLYFDLRGTVNSILKSPVSRAVRFDGMGSVQESDLSVNDKVGHSTMY